MEKQVGRPVVDPCMKFWTHRFDIQAPLASLPLFQELHQLRSLLALCPFPTISLAYFSADVESIIMLLFKSCVTRPRFVTTQAAHRSSASERHATCSSFRASPGPVGRGGCHYNFSLLDHIIIPTILFRYSTTS